jgi:hypothetical protein
MHIGNQHFHIPHCSFSAPSQSDNAAAADKVNVEIHRLIARRSGSKSQQLDLNCRPTSYEAHVRSLQLEPRAEFQSTTDHLETVLSSVRMYHMYEHDKGQMWMPWSLIKTHKKCRLQFTWNVEPIHAEGALSIQCLASAAFFRFRFSSRKRPGDLFKLHSICPVLWLPREPCVEIKTLKMGYPTRLPID